MTPRQRAPRTARYLAPVLAGVADVLQDRVPDRRDRDRLARQIVTAVLEPPVLVPARTLEALAVLHLPMPDRAGEYTSGDCAYCEDVDPKPPLIARVWGTVSSHGPALWVHEHADRHPTCGTCGSGDDGRESWPCATWRALPPAVRAVYQPEHYPTPTE